MRPTHPTVTVRAMKRLLLIPLAALTLAAGVYAAGNQPTTAEDFLAAQPVTYVGADWGPVPIYRVDLRPAINETIDVAANTPAEARQDTSVVSMTRSALAAAGMLATTTTATVAAKQQAAAPSPTPTPAPAAATSAPAPAAPASAAPAPTAAAVLDTTPATVTAAETTAPTPPAVTLNPQLATVASAALSKPVTITPATACYLAGRHVACGKLYAPLKNKNRHVTVRARGATAKRITVA